jgi:hypothetical protein
MSTSRRYLHFLNAVQDYNDANGGRAGHQRVDAAEAWNAFKWLLGPSTRQNMIDEIGQLYGNPRVAEYIHDLPVNDKTRLDFLRTEARRIMYIYRTRLAEEIARNHPAVVADEQQQQQQQRRRRRPVVPPIAAAATNTTMPPLVIPAFDMLRAMLERSGTLDVGDLALMESELNPTQIDQLFSILQKWGDCPICLQGVSKLYRWTYDCDDACCAACMSRFVYASIETANFPVHCPGRCGKLIDPRRVLDALSIATAKSGVQTSELVVRFVSFQLSHIMRIAPETASEVHSCPQCRAIVVGRLSVDSPMMRCTNPFCAQRFCTACKIPWHDGQKKCAEIAKDDEKSADVLNGTTKQCPRCKRRASHFRDHACHHLHCPCGYDYCYVCLQSWADHAVGMPMEKCRMFCHEGCHCVLCDECAPGKPCRVCVTGCPKCKVVVVPPPPPTGPAPME